MSFSGYLLLLLQVSCLAAEMTELWAEEGSSVTMHAPAIRNIDLVEWEYIRENIPKLILRYYAESQSVTIDPAYKGRVVFHQNNGSLVLQKLRETDSGIYKATVNSMQDKAATTNLTVLKPLPQPKLQSSSNLDGSLINLTCVLPEGTVADVSWKKDGHPLPPEKCFQLTGKNTVLQIRKAEKSVCGSYSCIINNTISLKEAALNLTMTERGCSEAVNLTIGFVIPAVAVVPTLLLLFLCYYKKNQEGQQQPDPQEVTHSLQTTSTSVTSSTHQVSPSLGAADTCNGTMNI
ncbi:CD48 antigen-like isoform X1 [Anas acuta]|uniref:CD48 antigen-like isoform X1 n=1 Tax=Anas acuta TaxID=28680 RepID=UPI0035C90430